MGVCGCVKAMLNDEGERGRGRAIHGQTESFADRLTGRKATIRIVYKSIWKRPGSEAIHDAFLSRMRHQSCVFVWNMLFLSRVCRHVYVHVFLKDMLNSKGEKRQGEGGGNRMVGPSLAHAVKSEGSHVHHVVVVEGAWLLDGTPRVTVADAPSGACFRLDLCCLFLFI